MIVAGLKVMNRGKEILRTMKIELRYAISVLVNLPRTI